MRVLFGAIGLVAAASLALILNVSSERALLGILIFSFSGFGLASTNFWALVQLLAAREYTARAVAWFNTISQIAGAVAPVLTGYVLGPRKDFSFPILLAASSAGLAASLLAVTGARGVRTLRNHFHPENFT